MNQSDRELLVRIDERVAVIKEEISIYRRELETLKKRVYSLCGGLAVIQVLVNLLSGKNGSH